MTKQDKLLEASKIVLKDATEPLLASVIQARLYKQDLVAEGEAAHVTLNYALQRAARDPESGVLVVGKPAKYTLATQAPKPVKTATKKAATKSSKKEFDPIAENQKLYEELAKDLGESA